MNRKFFGLLFFFIALAAFMIFQATKDTSALVLLPSDLIAKGEQSEVRRIRVGGRVVADSVQYTVQPQIELRFRVEDPKDPTGSVPVVYRGLRPDMFEPGRDVIIDGDYSGGTLTAAKLLTQCPSKYEPPRPKQPS